MSIRGIDGGQLPVGPAAAAGAQHTVRPGDTLEGIAKQHGTSLDQLVNNNPQLKSAAGIVPGQVLLLPAIQKQALAQAAAGDKLESSPKPSIFAKGDLAAASGQGSGDPAHVKLSASDLHTNEKGHLVVKNDQLAASFKHAMVAGKGIIQKSGGEAASLNFTRLNPATVQFYQEFLQRQAQGATGKMGESQVWQNARSGASAGAASETKAFGDPHAPGLNVDASTPKLDSGEARASIVQRNSTAGEHDVKISQHSLGTAAHASGEAKLWDVFRPAAGLSEDVKLENRRGGLAMDGGSKYPAGQALGDKVTSLPISPGESHSVKYESGRSGLDAGAEKIMGPQNSPAGAAQIVGPETMKLSSEHFEFNGEGHLVVKNDQLAEMLKSTLRAAAPGESVAFGVTAARHE